MIEKSMQRWMDSVKNGKGYSRKRKITSEIRTQRKDEPADLAMKPKGRTDETSEKGEGARGAEHKRGSAYDDRDVKSYSIGRAFICSD